MRKQKIRNVIGWGSIIIIILINLFLLLKLKEESLGEPPFSDLDITAPTLILILNENECATCVENLMVLNDIYTYIKNDGRIKFQGLILSKDKADPKGIAKAFLFPCEISDNFRILKRLNVNQTPLLIGLSKDRQIVYCDLLSNETQLDKQYVENVILDRLYYSLLNNRF